jgi:hypothetical protein
MSNGNEPRPMAAGDDVGRVAATISTLIGELSTFAEEDRARILRTVVAFFRAEEQVATFTRMDPRADQLPRHHEVSPLGRTAKEFMLEKQPRTEVERLAALGYYLMHERGTPHFKTEDLVALNFEAAQLRFGNAIDAAKNAVKLGYFIPAGQGRRQLSAVGEQVVEALPDRDAVKAALAAGRPRRRTRRRPAGSGELAG